MLTLQGSGLVVCIPGGSTSGPGEFVTVSDEIREWLLPALQESLRLVAHARVSGPGSEYPEVRLDTDEWWMDCRGLLAADECGVCVRGDRVLACLDGAAHWLEVYGASPDPWMAERLEEVKGYVAEARDRISDLLGNAVEPHGEEVVPQAASLGMS